MSWPGAFPAGRVIPALTEAVDIAPTILEACGLNLYADPRYRGPRAEMQELLLRWTYLTEDPMPPRGSFGE